MEKLDLATYGKEIKSNYDAVVSGDKTYAIYTTLKDSSLKPTALGDGDIKDFVSEFEEGSVQFGILRVNPFGSDVQKLILLGWCPDSAPIKSKVSYATNFSNVGKLLHYHVEITARDSDDLDIDDIMKTVSNASGARYSIQSLSPNKSTGSKFKPTPKAASPVAPEPVKSKPEITPSVIKPKPFLPPKKVIDTNDGWGNEKEIEERDFSTEPLKNLPSAYKPTKVDIDALRNSEPKTVSLNPSGGLTSLPKPKHSTSVLSRYNQDVVKPEVGTKAPTFDTNPSKDSSKLVGGLSRNFGASNGKTPAQLWAEKRGQYKEVENNDKPVNSGEVENGIEKDDFSVGNVKSKFEQLHMEAEKEEEEEQQKEKTPSHVSSFPPPPKREENNNVSSFPPPPKRDAFNKFEEKEDQKEQEEQEDEWNDEDTNKPEVNTPTPVARSLPPRPEPVEEAKPEPVVEPTVKPAETKSTGGASAIAEYEYEKDEDNEIGFKEGELIIDIEFVDEDWWQGTNTSGESGLFPSTYVKLQESNSKSEPVAASAPAPAPAHVSEPVAAEPETKSGPSAVAEYDYDASEDNELTFKEGDIISDIDQVDDDWWLGSFNGERKLFPANYVTLK